MLKRAQISLGLEEDEGGGSDKRGKSSGVNSKGNKKQKRNKALRAASSPTTPASSSFSDNGLANALLATLFFYLTVWNGIFSNLPLHVPMAFAVHSRFWFQPNMLVCMFSGLGVTVALSAQRFVKKPGPIVFFVVLYLAHRQMPLSDRSDATHNADYGRAILSSLPSDSLLLSHTDLDWNTVRYLRKCEGLGESVTHVSAQLLPYPWFQRQISSPSNLYGPATFPSILPGVSTSRFSEGNAVLVSRFLSSNLANFPGGVYCDMQAFPDDEIEAGGGERDETGSARSEGRTSTVLMSQTHLRLPQSGAASSSSPTASCTRSPSPPPTS